MAIMRALSPSRLLLLAFTLALGAGCRFGVGNDYDVTVLWLINGIAPTRSLCEAQGVDRIRLTVLSPGKQRSLYADCDEQVLLDDGYYYGGFVTTASFEYDKTYRYSVEMLDKNGRPLPNLIDTQSFRVGYYDDQPWVLRPLELVAPEGNLAGLRGSWTIEGQKPNAQSCERLGAESVVIDFASSTDENFENYSEILSADCASGNVVSNGAVLGEGEYLVRYVALDAEGDIVQDVVADSLYVVDEPGTLNIETIDFDL
jgi:hypothetical protein